MATSRVKRNDRQLKMGWFEKGQVQPSKQGHLVSLELLRELKLLFIGMVSLFQDMAISSSFLSYFILREDFSLKLVSTLFVLNMPYKSADGYQALVIVGYLVEP